MVRRSGPRPLPGLLLASVLAAASLGAGALPVIAQDAPPPACTGEAFRAFDFWVGTWVVLDPDGSELGRNRVTRIAGGCGLLEEWEGRGGGSGKSLNFHDPATGEWRQVWVGSGGALLDLRGGPSDGGMTLAQDRPGPDGGILRERIRWIPRDRGVVEQLWEASTDGGLSWTPRFRGLYHPAPGS